jgi:hypothetical protein
MNRVPETDFSKLIPELQKWSSGGKSISAKEWIGTVGNYEHLVAYAQILWPKFIEHDDCVFRALRFTEENYRGFMTQTNGDKPAVEAVMNHEHILDMFSNPSAAPSADMVIYVGRLLKDVWDAKLKRDFPARVITVSFPEGPFEDLVQYEVSFFQNR